MARLAEAEARAAEIKAWRTTGEAVQVSEGTVFYVMSILE
jgi:hypothetical protein